MAEIVKDNAYYLSLTAEDLREIALGYDDRLKEALNIEFENQYFDGDANNNIKSWIEQMEESAMRGYLSTSLSCTIQGLTSSIVPIDFVIKNLQEWWLANHDSFIISIILTDKNSIKFRVSWEEQYENIKEQLYQNFDNAYNIGTNSYPDNQPWKEILINIYNANLPVIDETETENTQTNITALRVQTELYYNISNLDFNALNIALGLREWFRELLPEKGSYVNTTIQDSIIAITLIWDIMQWNPND